MKRIKHLSIMTVLAVIVILTSCGGNTQKSNAANAGEEEAVENAGSGLKECPDDNHPHAIDLGLPSGTLWACCNLGANAPADNGNYFSWGETSPKNNYNWKTYQFGHDPDFLKSLGDITGTQYDAATQNWSQEWQMPTESQIDELLNACRANTWTEENGTFGRRFTAPNGASIFLPAAGYKWENRLYSEGQLGFYWSATETGGSEGAIYLAFNEQAADTPFKLKRVPGYTIRPVYHPSH